MPSDKAAGIDCIAAEPGGGGGASLDHSAIKRTTVHLHTKDQHKDRVDAHVKGGTDSTTDHQQPSDTGPTDNAATAPATRELPPWPVIDPFEEAVRRAQARGRIDKSQLSVSEPRRQRDPDHLKRVASRPCLVCGRNRAQAHHLTYLQPRAMGRKVSDEFTVPLCSTHHRELHGSGNERIWWGKQGIDPVPVARDLWQESRRPAEQSDCPEPDKRELGKSLNPDNRTAAFTGNGANQ